MNKLLSCQIWIQGPGHASQLFSEAIDHLIVGTGSIRDTQDELELALAIASLDPESGQKQPIMMVMVEDRMARLHFPIFLQSLVDVGVAQRLIVFVLDQQAHKICHKVKFSSVVKVLH